MNKKEFEVEILKSFPWINNDFFLKIETYKNYLIEENKKYNLTRLATEDKIYGDYFFASIFVYKDLIENKKQEILDVGSGSGIPGVLLALIFNQSNVTIVESNFKKINFIKSLCNKLRVENVILINERAEKLDDQLRDKFDVGTSRALSSLKIVCELITPFLKNKGMLVQPKSKLLEDEIEEAESIIEKLNLKITKKLSFEFESKKHNVICIEKTKKISKIYPREWKEIIKNE